MVRRKIARQGKIHDHANRAAPIPAGWALDVGRPGGRLWVGG
ncbi:hypothetical protein [Ochrobactrum sp. BTU1]